MKGGPVKRLTLVGVTPEGLVSWKVKQLDGGPVAVGVPVTLTAHLINKGTADTSMRVVRAHGLSCVPEVGVISSNDSLEIEIMTVLLESGVSTLTVEVEVRGGKILRLPIVLEGVIPLIEVPYDPLI